MYPTVAGSIFFTLEVLVLLAVLRDADDKIVADLEFLTAPFMFAFVMLILQWILIPVMVLLARFILLYIYFCCS